MKVSLPFFFFFFDSFFCFGQDQQFVSLRKYSQNEGLSSYNITKIIEDRNGFLWVGTQDGLNCFDGKKFTVFSQGANEGRKLAGNNVTDIVEDTVRDLLWVSTSYGGIVGIDIRTRCITVRIMVDQKGNSLTGKWIRSLNLTGDILWIGTYGGLLSFDVLKNEYVRIEEPDHRYVGIDSLDVGKIIVDKYSRVWACCNNYGIVVIDSKSLKIVNALPIASFNFTTFRNGFTFWDIAEGKNNEKYIATSWGLRKINFDNSGKIKIGILSENRLFNSEVLSCSLDFSGNLWFAKTNSLYKLNLNNSILSKVNDADFSSNNWQSSIYQIYTDRNNGIWLGSQEGLGYFLNFVSPFSYIFKSVKSDQKIQHAYTILPVNDSIIYCGTQNGLYRINQKEREVINIDKNSFCFLLYENFDKRIIVSNSAGTFVLIKEILIPIGDIYPSLKCLEKDILSSAVQYSDSVTIFGSQLQKGIYVWNRTSDRIRRIDNGVEGFRLFNNFVETLFKDSENRAWVLTENGIVLFDPASNHSKAFYLLDPETGKPMSIVYDMCETNESFWFAVYGKGLVETDKQLKIKKIITQRQGLSNNGVYKVVEYKNRYILLTSNNGLSVLDLSDRKIKNYFRADGLHSNAFEELCAVEKNNKIYAGGVNGFTIIDPFYFLKNNDPPLVYFDHIRTDTRTGSFDTSNLLLKTIAIPNDILQITVFISALNYRCPERIVNAYKIKELKGEWIELNGESFINLIGIGPGKYTLEVKSANEDGAWSDPIALTLDFLPKWYQTLWFKLLVIAAISGLLYAFYRYRIGQLGKQQQIRKDIASDLHDDIGSTLNTVKIFTHLAKREQQKEEHLTHIEESLAEATMGLRDMIWVLDDSQDTIRELSERIKKFAIPVTTANNIHFECSIGEALDDQAISKTAKRNLLLIAKETINNSIKYAACGHILVSIQRENGRLHFSIRDDGKGFDTRDPAQGNGLKNIQQRALQIRYEARIVSSPGNGTLVEIIGN